MRNLTRTVASSKFLLYICCAPFLVSAAGCSHGCNEIIPTKELVTPVVTMQIDPSGTTEFRTGFTPKYPGRYSINLSLTQRNPPNDSEEHFSLVGTFRIVGEGGTVIQKGHFRRDMSSHYIFADTITL